MPRPGLTAHEARVRPSPSPCRRSAGTTRRRQESRRRRARRARNSADARARRWRRPRAPRRDRPAEHAERSPDDVEPPEHVDVQPDGRGHRLAPGAEEGGFHAVDQRAHLDEVHRGVGRRPGSSGRPGTHLAWPVAGRPEIRMNGRASPQLRTANHRGRRARRDPQDGEVVVHG